MKKISLILFVVFIFLIASAFTLNRIFHFFPAASSITIGEDNGKDGRVFGKKASKRSQTDFCIISNEFFTNNLVDGNRPLDAFFKSVYEAKDTSFCRVAHYGDSQIEGDRITCAIRASLQQKFGGKGPGYIPFSAEANGRMYKRNSSMNWFRYTVFHNRYSSKNYGLAGTVFKYLRVVTDSLKNDTSIKVFTPALLDSVRYFYFDRGTISLRFNENIDFDNIKLYYGKCNAVCKINAYNIDGNKIILKDTLKINKGGLFMKYLKIPASYKKIKMEFIASESPELYGIFADGKNGIQVDNFAIRGHSGDGLMLIPSDFLAQQIRQLKVKCIIFQYGMNTVPYYKSDKACKELEEWYFKLFNKFREAVPEVSIVVVGPGDMAYAASSGGYGTYTFMPKINEAIKSAATRANCAYYDVYAMMGGKNSIYTWVKEKKAAYNGHFSEKGQQLVGEKIAEALLNAYEAYKMKREHN